MGARMFKKLWQTLRRWRARYTPSIVWRRQRIEVGIHFDLSKVDRVDLFEIEKLLHKNGIYFDTGSGFGNRDWEWDFSLRGPIDVRFKRKR